MRRGSFSENVLKQLLDFTMGAYDASPLDPCYRETHGEQS